MGTRRADRAPLAIVKAAVTVAGAVGSWLHGHSVSVADLHVSWSIVGRVVVAYCQPLATVAENVDAPERSSYHIEDTPRDRRLANLMRTPRILLLSPGAHEALLEDRRAG